MNSIDVNNMILEIEVNGENRQLVSACYICELMNIHRRLIQSLVRNNKMRMYNGLLDFDELSSLFPNLNKFNIIS